VKRRQIEFEKNSLDFSFPVNEGKNGGTKQQLSSGGRTAARAYPAAAPFATSLIDKEGNMLLYFFIGEHRQKRAK
jgi:hypothetical protein